MGQNASQDCTNCIPECLKTPTGEMQLDGATSFTMSTSSMQIIQKNLQFFTEKSRQNSERNSIYQTSQLSPTASEIPDQYDPLDTSVTEFDITQIQEYQITYQDMAEGKVNRLSLFRNELQNKVVIGLQTLQDEDYEKSDVEIEDYYSTPVPIRQKYEDGDTGSTDISVSLHNSHNNTSIEMEDSSVLKSSQTFSKIPNIRIFDKKKIAKRLSRDFQVAQEKNVKRKTNLTSRK